MTMMDLGSVKKDFSALISQIQPWTLSHFVMWLDIKVAEYKVFGRMIMGNFMLYLFGPPGISLTPYLESFTPTFELGTPAFPGISSNLHCGTPTFSKRCHWDSCFQNPSENPGPQN